VAQALACSSNRLTIVIFTLLCFCLELNWSQLWLDRLSGPTWHADLFHAESDAVIMLFWFSACAVGRWNSWLWESRPRHLWLCSRVDWNSQTSVVDEEIRWTAHLLRVSLHADDRGTGYHYRHRTYRNTSNIIRTFFTIKFSGKSGFVLYIDLAIFCRFISDWTIVKNGKITNYRNTGGAASAYRPTVDHTTAPCRLGAFSSCCNIWLAKSALLSPSHVWPSHP